MTVETIAARPRAGWIARHPILFGPAGLRGVWGALLFAAMLAGAHYGLNALLHGRLAVRNHEIGPGAALIYKSAEAASVLAATAIMAWIERRRLTDYGLRHRHPAREAAIGLGIGLFCLSVLAAALAGGGFLVFDGIALTQPLAAMGYAFAWLAAFFAVGVGEEMMFRGYLLDALSRSFGVWPACLLSSALFAAVHGGNGGITAGALGGIMLGGVLLCVLRRASGGLWVPIGFHTAWDWAQSYLYGTPDSGLHMLGHLFATHAAGDASLSGGTAGPEASLAAAPVALLTILEAAYLLRRRRAEPA